VLRINLDWQIDSAGYRTNENGKSTTIIGNGGKLVPTRPLHQNNMVFLAFAKVTSELELLKFVHHYGLLEKPSYDVRSGKVAIDPGTFAPIATRAKGLGWGGVSDLRALRNAVRGWRGFRSAC
jgi:hypothetical protein